MEREKTNEEEEEKRSWISKERKVICRGIERKL